MSSKSDFAKSPPHPTEGDAVINDDSRPLPPGWVAERNPDGVWYFVDTEQDDPQAVWDDPRPAYYARGTQTTQNRYAPPPGPSPHPPPPAYADSQVEQRGPVTSSSAVRGGEQQQGGQRDYCGASGSMDRGYAGPAASSCYQGQPPSAAPYNPGEYNGGYADGYNDAAADSWRYAGRRRRGPIGGAVIGPQRGGLIRNATGGYGLVGGLVHGLSGLGGRGRGRGSGW
ncbi:hypothetical protein JCM10207_005421 [Rhodosporidiobolus poonsookiae]